MKALNQSVALALATCLILVTPPAFADAQPPDEVAAGFAKIAKSRHAALAEAIRKDKKIESAVASYRVTTKGVLTDKKLKESERRKQMLALSAAFEPILKKIFLLAGINELKYQEEGERHIRRMATKRKMTYELKYLGYLGWWWKLNPPPSQSAPKPADREITLSTPFPLVQREHNGRGEETIDQEAGTYKVFSALIFGGAHDNLAGLAHFFEVDDNYDNIQVFAALPETEWSMAAFSDILAVFGSNTRSRIQVFRGNSVVCDNEVEHGSIIAPVLWFAEREGLDNVVINCEINGPDIGDEIVIRATSSGGVWGGGLGACNAFVKAKPRDLRLLLKY